MKIYCSCCDKVQPVRVDDCLDAKTNEPFQDIVCNECDLVIASGTNIIKPPTLNTDHVVLEKCTNACLCTHCGQRYQINMPVPISIMTAIIDAFIDSHRECQKTEEA